MGTNNNYVATFIIRFGISYNKNARCLGQAMYKIIFRNCKCRLGIEIDAEYVRQVNMIELINIIIM